jgi:hypothetical protein
MEKLGVPLVLLRMRRPVPVWKIFPLLVMVVVPLVAPRVMAIVLPAMERVAPAATLPVSPALSVFAVVSVPLVTLKLVANAVCAMTRQKMTEILTIGVARFIRLRPIEPRDWQRDHYCDILATNR